MRFIHSSALLVSVLLACRPAFAGTVDRAKLRDLLTMPQLSYGLTLKFNAVEGFQTGKQSDTPRRIAALRATLHANPNDASAWEQLGDLYQQTDDTQHARAAYRHAVPLYRRTLAAHPSGGRALAGLGSCLAGLDRYAEAEPLLRRAVKVSPNNWQAWLALGEYRSNRVWTTLFQRYRRSKPWTATLAQLAEMPAGWKLTAKQMAAARSAMKDAGACYDRAVACAPNEPRVFLERATFRGLTGTMMAVLTAVQSGGLQSVQDSRAAEIVGRTMFGPEVLADLRRAADLQPAQYGPAAAVTLMDVSHAIVATQKNVDDGDFWADLPENQRTPILADLDRLRKGAEARGPDEAHALALIGFVQCVVIKELDAAEKSLRAAIALDPGQTDAWDALVQALIKQDRFTDLRVLGEQRLKHDDTPRNRVLLAKACEKLGSLANAQAQVAEALKKAPDDFTANLAMAALLLKQRDDDATVRAAGERLACAGRNQPKDETTAQWTDYAVTRGIYLALADYVDDARKQLQQVLERDSANAQAKAALAAIGG